MERGWIRTERSLTSDLVISRRDCKRPEKGQASYAKIVNRFILFKGNKIVTYSIPSVEDVYLTSEEQNAPVNDAVV